MDKGHMRDLSIEDMARDLLVGICCGVSENDLTAKISPKDIDGGKENADPLVCDGKEKYRSELMSISHLPSPDVKVLQLLPVDLDC